MPIDNFIFIAIFVIWVCYLNTFFQSVTCFYFFIFIFHFTSFFNSCSIRVICIFPPLLSPGPLTPTSQPPSYPSLVCPWVLHTCSLTTFPHLSPVIPLPSPLVTVSYSFQYLWLFFCLMVCFVDEVSNYR